jgi:hypothetical protein
MAKLRLPLLLLPLSLFNISSAAQVPTDVPKDHWAYKAVRDLGARGLIKGFPPDSNFIGNRIMTRYEMATIIQRVLLQIDAIYAKKIDVGAPEQQVKPKQIEEIRKLVEEFKAELLVIGSDLTKLKEQINELSARVGVIVKKADKAAADAAAVRKVTEGAKKDVAEMKKTAAAASKEIDNIAKVQNSHKISGYIQGRFDAVDVGRTSLFTNTGAGGTGQTPTNGGPAVGGPFYGFQVRRARINFTGPISSRGDYKIQVDAQSGGAVGVYDANVAIADFPFRRVSARFGMFPPPFGYELPTSSGVRESPERSFGWGTTSADYPIFKTSQSATGGIITPGSVNGIFVNQQRDIGAAFVWDIAGKGNYVTQATLSVINGEGRSAGGIRNSNNGVDVLGRIEAPLAFYKVKGGLSFYYGNLALRGGPPTGAAPTPVTFVNSDKILGGADLRWTSPWKTQFRAEWFGGILESTPDRAQFLDGNHVYAWNVMARHPLTHKLDFVTKYDEYYPISQAGKTAGGLGRMELVHKTLGLGGLYRLDGAIRLRLWYAKGLTPYDPSAASGPLRSRLGLITGEVQVSF